MTKTLTCSKRYTDLPFAHRQPNHDGHCSVIHGHNWSIEFEFSADKLDQCGFVIDFGKLKFLKEWLHERFDHTLVLNHSDPFLGYMQTILTGLTKDDGKPTLLANIIPVPDCSCEGLASWLLDEVNTVIENYTAGRVHVSKVIVIEDEKNHATAGRYKN